ncbi:hypothetical protein CTEN210_09172 [Chaetoceros tenuissimus]|uniref:G-protein coupled receptors family 1 profile domain-containing protein n=1 Tax=Chaetoceros tenuissimus TaxID=426638 RepID=A0AAD3H740_9STRA|nr:hypothetical protein CTEN210_09172 [Chaetoceros tenuissimus]
MSSLLTSNKLWHTSAALQVSSGAVSFICSSSLAYMIKANKEKGLKNPYRRLIFAISVADMMQSLSIVLGPFINDAAVSQARWAIGNEHSCRLNGLLLALGSTAVPLYSCSLSIYYYCKLYKKMTNERFWSNIERWMHIIIITSIAVMNIIALSLNLFNSGVNGSLCFYAAAPTGCAQNPEIYGECNSSPHLGTVRIFTLISALTYVLCMALVVLFLSFLLWKIVATEKIFSMKANSTNVTTAKKSDVAKIEKEITVKGNAMNITNDVEFINVDNNISSTPNMPSETSGKDDSQMARAYRQEMSLQLILYSLSFLCTYLLLIVLQFILATNKDPTIVLWLIAQTLYPLQGFFNILVFIRPAARVTRIRRDGISWLKAYYLVAKNGGEAVVEDNLPMSNNSKPQTSVKYGVESPPSMVDYSKFDCASNECMYVDSSIELSRDNAAYNSSQDWHYIKGGSQNESSGENAKGVIAGIHHNDLDAIVEDESFVEDSMDLSYQTK